MKLSRRSFLGTAGAAGAAAAWGLGASAAAVDLAPLPADGQPQFVSPDHVLRGLGHFIDAHSGLATLLDRDFRIMRTTRSHQELLRYDPSDMYEKPSEKYWSRDMRSVIEGIGGLRDFRRIGVCSIDFTLVRRPHESGFGNELSLVSIGRTVAIGDPRLPLAYLTTFRIAESNSTEASAVITCLDHAS